MASSSVLATTRWQDIQGKNDWKGLLEPVDPDLRDAGIRYGELIEAVYDAIDMEEESEYIYYSLYGKSKIFPSVGIQPNYIVTSYLYSTLTVNLWGRLFGFKEGDSTAWLGYIAVSNDEETKRLGRRDVAIIFRGTKARDENWLNIHFNMTDFKELGPPPYPKVMAGFLSMYTASDPSKPFGRLSVRQQVFQELTRLIQVEYKDEDMSITFLGHSMGAGMAPIAAADFGYNMQRPAEGRTVMVSAFIFGAPKTGDEVFKERAEKSCKVIRIVDTGDVVTLISPVSISPPGVYEHIGVEWKVNWADSPFVQDLGFLSMKCHNLELYLHCIAGQKSTPSMKVYNTRALQLRTVSQVTRPADVEIPEELDFLKEFFKDDMDDLQEYANEQAAVVNASRLLQDGSRSRKRLRGSRNAVNLSASSTFEIAVERPYALMNKSDDIVLKELKIPPSWWEHGFKNMRKINGKWLPRHEWPPEDIPSDENPEFNY